MPSRRATIAVKPLLVSPRTSSRSGRCSSRICSIAADDLPDLRAESVSAYVHQHVRLHAHRARARTVRSAARRSSGRCGRARATTCASSSGMIRLRRMISGRVPRTVITFIAAPRRSASIDLAQHQVAVDAAAAASASGDITSPRRAVFDRARPCGASSPASTSGSIGRIAYQLPRSTVRYASSSLTMISWIFSPGRMPVIFDRDLQIADQRGGDVDDARRRRPRHVGLARRASLQPRRRPYRPRRRG